MAIVHIKETVNDDLSITLHVDGRLEPESITTVEEVCQRHLAEGLQVVLNIEGLYHISREGRNFLDTIKDKVTLERIPSFIKLSEEP